MKKKTMLAAVDFLMDQERLDEKVDVHGLWIPHCENGGTWSMHRLLSGHKPQKRMAILKALQDALAFRKKLDEGIKNLGELLIREAVEEEEVDQ